MRLTLRTMLAYMDGILDPNDARDIGQKIEASEYASSLVHRTRDAMRRLRLTAPTVAEGGSGLDANTVAEYLDNTLADDRVPDFEKVCLDSDTHLAEVASCHQILTLVLGEPAEIDPDSRQRMYQLPRLTVASAEPQPPEPSASTPPVAPEALAAPAPRPKPTVPDYLRESRGKRRWVPIAAGTILACCFLGVVLAVFGQFEPGTPLGKLLGLDGKNDAIAEKPDEGDDSGTPGADSADDATEDGARQENGDGADGGPDTPEIPTDPATEGMPSDVTPDAGQDAPDNGTSPELIDPLDPEQPAVLPGVAEDPADEPMAEAAQPPLPAENPPLPSELDPAVDPPMPTDPVVAEVPDTPAVDDRPAPPQQMGRLMSRDQVLLISDPQRAVWQRVAVKGLLYPKCRLLALPTYRPEITLSAGIDLQLLGGSEIELLTSDATHPVGLDVRYGRAVIMPLAEAGTRIRLVIGDLAGVLTFADVNSIVALRVTPMHPPGEDPEVAARSLLADLYVKPGDSTQPGHVLWQEEGRPEPVRVEVGKRLALTGAPDPKLAPVAEFPRWIAEDPISFIDRQASSSLQEMLRTDRTADLGLMESADDRRKEVRWLAKRCLALIGQLDLLVAALNEEERKLDRPDYIVQLIEAVRRSPESAAAVRLAIEKRYGDDAKALCRMLWGYSYEGLKGTDPQDGEAQQLIDHLDDDVLAVRALAFWNLKEMTGWGHNYSPELSDRKRTLPIRSWNERLRNGEFFAKIAEANKAPAAEETAPVSEDEESPL